MKIQKNKKSIFIFGLGISGTSLAFFLKIKPKIYFVGMII